MFADYKNNAITLLM